MTYIVSGEAAVPEQQTNRTARLEARIAPEALAVVRRAAEIQGRSVSDFVVAAAQEAAQKTVAEVEVLRLSRAAQEQFARLLAKPPAPTPALKKAFARHRTLIRNK
jgi:uncharacterized protein (DUF1778 family)